MSKIEIPDMEPFRFTGISLDGGPVGDLRPGTDTLGEIVAAHERRCNRDAFLLAKLLPATDSPRLCGMIYDAVTAELGQPGSGYVPVELFHCAQRHWVVLHPKLIEAEKDGFQAAKDAGWY